MEALRSRAEAAEAIIARLDNIGVTIVPDDDHESPVNVRAWQAEERIEELEARIGRLNEIVADEYKPMTRAANALVCEGRDQEALELRIARDRLIGCFDLEPRSLIAHTEGRDGAA